MNMQVGDLVWCKWQLKEPVKKRNIGLIVGKKEDYMMVEWTVGKDTLHQADGGYLCFNLVRIS